MDEEYKQLRDKYGIELLDGKYLTQQITYIEQLFTTITHNNFWVHAESRLRKFFKYYIPNDKTIVNDTIDYVLNKDSVRVPNETLISKAVEELGYDREQRLFRLKDEKKKFHLYFKLFFKLQQFFVAKRLGTFKLIPQFTHGAHHITYDTRAFGYLLKSLGLYDGNALNTPASEWSKWISYEKLETGNRQFGYSIQTDGYSVSFSMDEQKERKADLTFEEILERYDNNQYTQFIGVDPGGDLIFAIVRKIVGTEEFVNEKHKSSHCRHLRGDNDRKQKRQALTKHFDEVFPSSIPPYEHEAYTENRICFLEQKQKLCSVPAMTKLKHDSYMMTKKITPLEMARLLVGDVKFWQHTLVFLGAGKIAANSPIKGHARTSVERVVEYLKRIADVVYIDEFRTTILCSECHILQKTSKSPHRYQYCVHCNTNWNRDINAANNMLYLGKCFDFKYESILKKTIEMSPQ